MTENFPQSLDDQANLGAFYLEKNEPKAAIEHFRLALEISEDKQTRASLGAAYFKIGRRDYAEECWADVLEDEQIESGLIYFQTLQEYGLAAQAREKLPIIIIKFLEMNNADKSEDFQNLIRELAASFDGEAEKSTYFLQILSRRPTDTSLAAMLVDENLIGAGEQKKFYELLINRADKIDYYDYSYKSVLRKVWTISDAESVYDAESGYKTEEPEKGLLEWQKKYLEFLVDEHENASSARLIQKIEGELKGRYARPAWLRLAALRQQIRDGKFDRTQAESFIGITISDSATEIKPPSLERFNEVLRILKDEKREAEANQLSEAFFARMLALEQFDAANFTGLARAFFQKGETEKALRILHLMIDAGNEQKRETALAEITSIDAVQARSADAAKLAETNSTSNVIQTNTLKLAAEICAEFQQIQSAIDFRRRLLELNKSDWANQIELAKLLNSQGEKSEAAKLLNEIIGSRDALRPVRWQARMLLRETGESADFPNVNFDSFSQFYQGIFAAKSGENEVAAESFRNALIADKDTQTAARQELIKTYTESNNFFAALKLVGTDNSEKSDALLQMLAEAAEKVGDFGKAIEFEKAKTAASEEKIKRLERLAEEKNRRATDLTVDLENTKRK